jgi:hypothetical protein
MLTNNIKFILLYSFSFSIPLLSRVVALHGKIRIYLRSNSHFGKPILPVKAYLISAGG